MAATLLHEAVTVDRAITVRHSWAFGIAAGFKPVENRGAMCNYTGTVALHTSRTLDGFARLATPAAEEAFQTLGGISSLWDPATPSPDGAERDTRLALGALIAVVDIVGCHHAATVADYRDRTCCQPWGQALHRSPSGKVRPAVHIELANPRVLEHPIPVRGQPLLLWRLPPPTVEQLATTQLLPPNPHPRHRTRQESDSWTTPKTTARKRAAAPHPPA